MEKANKGCVRRGKTLRADTPPGVGVIPYGKSASLASPSPPTLGVARRIFPTRGKFIMSVSRGLPIGQIISGSSRPLIGRIKRVILTGGYIPSYNLVRNNRIYSFTIISKDTKLSSVCLISTII